MPPVVPPVDRRARRRFVRYATPHDGNCFFHALRKGLQLLRVDAPSAAELRRRVSDRMRRGAATPAQHAAAVRASTDRAWAEQEEVSAAAAECGVRIRVWEGHNDMWVTFGDDAAPLVYLYNSSNTHFDAIRPLALAAM